MLAGFQQTTNGNVSVFLSLVVRLFTVRYYYLNFHLINARKDVSFWSLVVVVLLVVFVSLVVVVLVVVGGRLLLQVGGDDEDDEPDKKLER